MGKVIIIFFIMVFFMMFASRNFDDVVVRFLFGSPMQIPLITVIVSSFIVGYAMALFSFVLYLAKRKKDD